MRYRLAAEFDRFAEDRGWPELPEQSFGIIDVVNVRSGEVAFNPSSCHSLAPMRKRPRDFGRQQRARTTAATGAQSCPTGLRATQAELLRIDASSDSFSWCGLTVRPCPRECLFAGSALCINPTRERFQSRPEPGLKRGSTPHSCAQLAQSKPRLVVSVWSLPPSNTAPLAGL